MACLRLLLATALLAATFVAPKAEAADAPALADWAGRYVDSNFNQRLEIDSKGNVKSTGALFFGGDAGLAFHARGVLQADGDVLLLALHDEPGLHGNAEMPPVLEEPRRLRPIVWQQRRFLMDDAALNDLVNQVNIYGQRSVGVYAGLHEILASEPYFSEDLRVDADAVLPPEYRVRLLAAPLDGHVTRLVSSEPIAARSGPSAFPVGPPPRPEEGPPLPPLVWRRTTLEVDLGSADGVFVGMLLCVSEKADEHFVVESVAPHEATLARPTTHDFVVGDAVSSHSFHTGR
jgi:hypothetical protein